MVGVGIASAHFGVFLALCMDQPHDLPVKAPLMPSPFLLRLFQQLKKLTVLFRSEHHQLRYRIASLQSTFRKFRPLVAFPESKVTSMRRAGKVRKSNS